MEGIDRLEAEVIELDNYSITKIFNYLKTRKDLYEKFNNEEKSMDQMYDYIYNKAKKYEHKRMAMIDDPVVYLWAVTYFIKSNEELGIKAEKEVAPSENEEIKELDKDRTKKEKEDEDNQITLFQEVKN